jgi:hypothetical protein
MLFRTTARDPAFKSVKQSASVDLKAGDALRGAMVQVAQINIIPLAKK